MKILVVSDAFTRGGLETQIKTYYDNLPKDNEMIFAFSKYTGEVVLENAKIHTNFHFSYSDTVKDVCEDVDRLIEIINKENIDIIHVHPFFAFYSSIFASQITKTPLIYSYHGFISFNYLNSITLSSIFKFSFEVNAVGQLHTVNNSGINCFENLGYKNSIFIPNPVDTKYFKTIQYIRNNKWAIISRLDADKITEIKLLLLNKDKYGIDTIDIYGTGSEIENLENFINENNLSNSVQLKGFCSDIYNTLDQKYNGVIGIGRVVLEGLTMGLPVLLIGYGKLTGFINRELYDKISPLNFTNIGINDTNLKIPKADEIFAIQQDVIANYSIDAVLKTYMNAIQYAESVYLNNFSKIYTELKVLANNPNTSILSFANDRNVYNIIRNNIKGYSIDNSINNMFISTDFFYQKYDELIAPNNILLSNQQSELVTLRNKIYELEQKVYFLEQKELYRFTLEQARFDKRSRKLYVKIGRKIKRFLNGRGKDNNE